MSSVVGITKQNAPLLFVGLYLLLFLLLHLRLFFFLILSLLFLFRFRSLSDSYIFKTSRRSIDKGGGGRLLLCLLLLLLFLLPYCVSFLIFPHLFIFPPPFSASPPSFPTPLTFLYSSPSSFYADFDEISIADFLAGFRRQRRRFSIISPFFAIIQPPFPVFYYSSVALCCLSILAFFSLYLSLLSSGCLSVHLPSCDHSVPFCSAFFNVFHDLFVCIA